MNWRHVGLKGVTSLNATLGVDEGEDDEGGGKGTILDPMLIF